MNATSSRPAGRTVGILFAAASAFLWPCLANGNVDAADDGGGNATQWQEIELSFTSEREPTNPYTDVVSWVDFTHDDGTTLRRQMFWDGGKTFRVRFTSTRPSGNWKWASSDRDGDPGLNDQSGSLQAIPTSAEAETVFAKHGFWMIPPGGRNLIHADGTARLLCADTAWALPWRATPEQAEIYGRDRAAKGFNAALLMTVQPDMQATGPRSRTEDGGFDVGFEDLPQGTLQQLNPEYFQRLDQLVKILTDRGIAPVYQPVFASCPQPHSSGQAMA